MTQPLKVWSRFTVSKENKINQLRIVEAPKDRVEDIANFIVENFIKYESIAKATGVVNSKEAIAMYRSQLLANLKLPGVHMLVCCADDGNINEIGDIIGSALMWLTEDDKPRSVQSDSKELRKFFEVVNATKDWCHIIEELNVLKYYDARILAVQPNYRGLGIAMQFLKLMPQVCKEDGVPLIVGTMTTIGSQKAAARAGWKTYFETNLQAFRKNIGVHFADDAPPQIKLMVVRLDKVYLSSKI